MTESENDVAEYISDLIRSDPTLSVDSFKKMFFEALSRKPTLKEVTKFQTARDKGNHLSTTVLTNKVINGYTVGEMLGKGSFGEVYKCKKGDKEYALKCIDESKMGAEVEQAFADSISARLNSKFLVKYVDKFRGPSKELFVVMELCPRGDLRLLIETLKRLKASLDPERIAKILIQLLLGMEVIHRNKILHRDLKPENIFVDEEDNTKIGDFGCAKELDTTSQKANTMISTPFCTNRLRL